ncbi:MAG: hypothetical protein QNI87_08450 [Erythrobacter sp.]|uniref:PAS domain-containing protein n=1 Tax=Erythrobacter sp. TaxID=1042 RepID=UPI002612C7B2|nr:hypothetical protein [Erythrobacter sp.]MDJ0978554.1 hypothetical protein [Erythrobacter sp.]
MDTLRGAFGSDGNEDRPDFEDIHDLGEENEAEGGSRDLPPASIGQDERRMQVRAYNHWASLLGDRTFPSIEDLEPEHLPDFGPHSVLLDFSAGIEDPVVQYLGSTLADECGAPMPIERLSDVPARSLLSRITDHYLQIMANQAPIGFEAEFVNQRGVSILYRGILLPFSSDDESIDFIYGVINWKEMADAATADELLLEIDQALEADEEGGAPSPARHHADPIADWADSPAHEAGEEDDALELNAELESDNVAEFNASDNELSDAATDGAKSDLPSPDFGQYALDDPDADLEDEEDDGISYNFASLSDYIEAPAKKAVDLDADKFDPSDYSVPEAPEPDPAQPAAPPITLEPPTPADDDVLAEDGAAENVLAEDGAADIAEDLPEDAGLLDCLASARELARTARASEDRSRQALYAAVGRAYDFSLAAQDASEEYERLIEDSGLTVQDRAPMTPVVKLVFGSDYDKTRLTEYAAVLNHAHRLELERGALADFLKEAEGGLKGVVNAERRLRREEAGKTVEPEHTIRAALAQKLRELEALTLEALAKDGPEFSLVMVRRGGEGEIDVVGEIADDTAMIERAARKLVG